jgi:glycosyltransferase involved in cell wall biosynthesis
MNLHVAAANVGVEPRYWIINGRFLSQPSTGVQRYAEEIVRALDEFISLGGPGAEGLKLEILCPRGSRAFPGLRSISVRQVGPGNGHLWEQLTLPRHLKGSLLSLGNTGPLSVAKQIVCIHDANTRVFPESYSKLFRLLYRLLLPALGRRAAKIATVSAFSKSQLEAFGIAPRHNIAVIPNGYEHAERRLPLHTEMTQQAAGLNTVVMIGSPAPHKNMALVLSLAGEFRRLGLKLAIVGAVDRNTFGCFSDSSQSSATATDLDNVIWLGRIPNDAMTALLKDSLCLVFPSFTEGFGLPPLEAMAIGCPVIASDRASIPEVCGEACLYAPPDDAAIWLRQISRLHSDSKLRAILIEEGRAQAKHFSWRNSAQLYINLMRELDNN